MPSPAPVELFFRIDQETKNKVRFQEVTPVTEEQKKGEGVPVPKERAVIEKLYVSKAQLKKWGNPESLVVIVKAP